MRKLWWSWLLLGAWIWAQSYTYGNEWYDPTRPYRKLLVAQDKVYRVRAADLGLNGVPVATLRLIWRGQVVPIYVGDLDGSGTFEGNDYIEFYGQRNDGWPDSIFFRHPHQLRYLPGLHGNPYMPLNRNDTSAYYLTWGGSPGIRYTPYEDIQVGTRPVIDWFWYQMVESFHTSYYWPGPGGLWTGGHELHNNPMYIAGEGGLAGFNPYAWVYTLPGAVANVVPAFTVEVSHASLAFGGTYQLNWEVLNGYNNQVIYAGPTQNLTAPYYQRLRMAIPGDQLVGNVIVRCTSPTQGYRGEGVHYGAITYPRAWNSLGGVRFITLGVVNPDPTPKALALAGLSVGAGDSVIAYDTLHKLRIRLTWDGTRWLLPLPAIADTFPLVLTTGAEVAPVAAIQVPRLLGYSTAQGAEIILVTHPSLQASAEAYKLYRETHPTNPHSVFIAYTDAIDDEFGWGRIDHPAGIRNLVRWALDQWPIKPKYLLLWGDAVNPATLGTTYNGPKRPNHKVPVFGLFGTRSNNDVGGSDWGFVSDFYGDGNVIPAIPVGRVPLQNDAQGFAYIDKLRTYESGQASSWRKWGLHLGGGANAVEQALIRAQLVACQNIFESSPYAGQIVYYQKQTGGMQAPPGSPSIKDRIDSGVVIIQTFGHTGEDVFDLAFYEPTDYENWGRFPLVIVNGCYQGDVSSLINGTQNHGERFVLAPGRGSLWYWSLGGAGFIGPLGDQSRRLYEVLFRDSIGMPVGDAFVEVFRRLFSNGAAAFNYYHMAGSVLLGDPCVPLISPRKPDLAITMGDISIRPNTPYAEQNSFEVTLRYRNLGLAITDSFTVQVQHRIISSGQTFTYTYRRPPFLRQDSFTITLPAPPGEWAGVNEIVASLDTWVEIEEEREDNNTARVEFFVQSPRPILIYPWPFAVINKDSIALIAGTYNQSSFQSQGYYFEIDTSYLFNSPMLRQSGLIQGTSVYGQWVLPFRLQDSVVYYWRARLANAGAQEWAEASFQYIRGDKEGWGQSRPPQFRENIHRGLLYSGPPFQWQFQQRSVRLEVRDTWSPVGNRRFLIMDGQLLSTQEAHSLLRNGVPVGWWEGAWMPGIFIAAFDKDLFTPLIQDSIFGAWRYFCPRGVCYWASYQGPDTWTPARMADSLWSIIQSLPNGSIVVLLITQWHKPARDFALPQMANVLNAIGASAAVFGLDSLQKAILIGAKGAPPGSALEVIVPDSVPAGAIKDYTTSVPIGWMISPPIAAPVAWEEFFFQDDSALGRGHIRASVYAKRVSGGEDTVYRWVSAGPSYGLTSLNGRGYSSLRLEGLFIDTIASIAPAMRYWYVFFQPFPDVAVDPSLRWVLRRDTVDEGESISVEIGLRNLLSATTPESVAVRFSVQKADGNWIDVGEVRLPPLAGLDTAIVRYTFSSVGLSGLNRLRIIANPDYRFGERTYANNRWEASFYVRADIYNPVVDVLFDGYRIQNGDIVSPNPTILIEVKDENRYLALDDTSGVTVRLRRAEEGGLGQRIDYASGKLRFEPARLPDNRARVEFRPGRLEDGDYVLSVEARDKRANRSGIKPYDVQFRVINESSITHVVNYPNPFSTSTRFYYELTGAQLPEVFQIHIYTVTGRLVKVIDLKALGEVRIGRHLTSYAWDGRDEYGDQLANGVYLYRVILKMPGEGEIKKREDGLEGYFKSGWGKMVLMR
jgi:hypothetical protein